ncbi:hypothetical protein HY498_02025 [Candidatus Woesearchaeota archaeon]|nr:hypothetical protein [Candidatus Woesearchaeota archaeon]
MRIAFFVTGFGYGDSIRVHAVIRELLKEYPKTEIMIFGYDNSYEYFKDGFKIFKIKGYRFPDDVFGFKIFRFILKNLFLPLYWLLFSFNVYHELKDFDPDLIINDFEMLGCLMAKKLGKRCISIFGFDPEVYNEYPSKNFILNLQMKFIKHIYDLSDRVIISSYNSKFKEKFNYVNPIIRAQPEEFDSESYLMKKLGFKKKPILVMLGGSNYGVSLAKRLFKLRKKFSEEFVFFGSEIIVSEKHFKFKENYLEYLKICKGVITLAGNLTMSECMVYKKPMLVFPIKNHVEQLLNVYTLRDYLEFGNIDDIENSLKLFLNRFDEIKRNIEKAHITGYGAVEVVDIIEESLKS